MGINSINNNRLGGRVLTNAQINSLLSNGLTLKLINDYLGFGYSYNQMITAWQSETALGYIAKFGGTLESAITALTGLTAANYASSNGFSVEGFGGNNYLRRDFTSGTTSWAVPSRLEGYSSIALVVAGGGSGGWDVGGGGGGGGVIYNQNFVTSGTLTATVGAGGNPSGAGHPQIGGSGSNSIFGSLVAIGGGAGGNYSGGAGQNGGSGGGGSSWSSNPGNAAGNGTSGQGYNGGAGFAGTGQGGGGGGAGGPGSAGIGSTSGTAAGGIGISVFGTTYSTGGRGFPDSGTASPGASNTGNGGDAQGNAGTSNGGSGIIILRYKLT